MDRNDTWSTKPLALMATLYTVPPGWIRTSPNVFVGDQGDRVIRGAIRAIMGVIRGDQG